MYKTKQKKTILFKALQLYRKYNGGGVNVYSFFYSFSITYTLHNCTGYYKQSLATGGTFQIQKVLQFDGATKSVILFNANFEND